MGKIFMRGPTGDVIEVGTTVEELRPWMLKGYTQCAMPDHAVVIEDESQK